MNALTKAEREDLLAKIDALNQRIVDLERDERSYREKIEQLDEDVANGKAGAKAEAIRLDEKARAAHLEIEACQRAASTAQRRWKDDEPFRDAEREAERKNLCRAAIEVSVGKAKAVDVKAREFVASILEHQESLNAPVEHGVDPHMAFVLHPQHWLSFVLHAAGAKRYDANLQGNPGGPNTLEERTREFLRV